MQIRNRIKELRHVRAGDLRPHPKNWRKHPEAQQNALRGILAEVGDLDALIFSEPDGDSWQRAKEMAVPIRGSRGFEAMNKKQTPRKFDEGSYRFLGPKGTRTQQLVAGQQLRNRIIV